MSNEIVPEEQKTLHQVFEGKLKEDWWKFKHQARQSILDEWGRQT